MLLEACEITLYRQAEKQEGTAKSKVDRDIKAREWSVPAAWKMRLTGAGLCNCKLLLEQLLVKPLPPPVRAPAAAAAAARSARTRLTNSAVSRSDSSSSKSSLSSATSRLKPQQLRKSWLTDDLRAIFNTPQIIQYLTQHIIKTHNLLLLTFFGSRQNRTGFYKSMSLRFQCVIDEQQ